jgi:hypothetical protein
MAELAAQRSCLKTHPILSSAAQSLGLRTPVVSTAAERRSCFRTNPVYHRPEVDDAGSVDKNAKVGAQREHVKTFLQILRRVSLNDSNLVSISLRSCSMSDQMFTTLAEAGALVGGL